MDFLRMLVAGRVPDPVSVAGRVRAGALIVAVGARVMATAGLPQGERLLQRHLDFVGLCEKCERKNKSQNTARTTRRRAPLGCNSSSKQRF